MSQPADRVGDALVRAVPIAWRRRHSLRRRQALRAYMFIAPSVVVMGVFVLWPLISSARLSLYNSSEFGPSTFVGLRNYKQLFADPVFMGDLWHTLIYAAVVTPVTVGLALMFAIMLNRQLKGRTFFRAAIFLPAVLSLGVMGIAWDYLLNPNVGLLPQWLAPVGISFGAGQADPTTAFVFIVIVGIWKNIGFYMVMYLAGLSTIPQEFYEAASVDGASKFRQFRTITWPLLANTSAFVFIMAAIASLQAFDQIYSMTRGGPYFSTETLAYLLYREGFLDLNFGYASAVAWVLTMIVFAVSLVQRFFFSRREIRY